MYPNRPASRSENFSRRNSVSRSGSRMGKETVCLFHGCYICGNILSTASATRNHIARIHGMYIPPRGVGIRRPQEKEYVFESQDQKYDSDHYACPSCWFHCPQDELDDLNAHTLKDHNPQPIQNEGNNYELDDDEEDMPKTGRRQSFSSNRPLSRSDSRTGIRQNGRPASRQSNRPNSRTEAHQEDVGEISKKLDELIDLFKAMFK